MVLPRDPKLERVPLAGAGSFAVREFRQARFESPWHQHREAELTWILRGSGLRYVGDSAEPFAPGDLCLLGGGLPHAWISPLRSRAGVHSLVVQFDPTMWGADFWRLPEMRGVARLLGRADRGLQFSGAVRDRAAAQLLGLAALPPRRRLAPLLALLQQLAEARLARPLALAAWKKMAGARVTGGSTPCSNTSIAAMAKRWTRPNWRGRTI